MLELMTEKDKAKFVEDYGLTGSPEYLQKYNQGQHHKTAKARHAKSVPLLSFPLSSNNTSHSTLAYKRTS